MPSSRWSGQVGGVSWCPRAAGSPVFRSEYWGTYLGGASEWGLVAR